MPSDAFHPRERVFSLRYVFHRGRGTKCWFGCEKTSQCCCDGDGSREVLRDDGNVEGEGVPPPLKAGAGSFSRALWLSILPGAPATPIALVRRDGSTRPSHASCWCVLSLTQPKRSPTLILITAARVRSLSHGLAFFENARTSSYNTGDNRIASLRSKRFANYVNVGRFKHNNIQ